MAILPYDTLDPEYCDPLLGFETAGFDKNTYVGIELFSEISLNLLKVVLIKYLRIEHFYRKFL
jgi:hypothetical protein